ncbi:hypothetical protein [Caudoviricetes sp.]|nr:hypothetical protein [Caudoviricetes sp.]
MLPITVEIPYEPKPPMSKVEREKLFKERNLGTFRRSETDVTDPTDLSNY